KTKQTITKILSNSLLIILLGTLLAGQAHGQIIYETSQGGTIGEYDATTGAAINPSLVSGLNSPFGIAVSGANLYVANTGSGTVGELQCYHRGRGERIWHRGVWGESLCRELQWRRERHDFRIQRHHRGRGEQLLALRVSRPI